MAEQQQNLAKQNMAEQQQNLAKQNMAEQQQNLAKQNMAEQQQNLAKQNMAEQQQNLAKKNMDKQQQNLAKQNMAGQQQNLASKVPAEKLTQCPDCVIKKKIERKLNMAKQQQNLAKQNMAEQQQNLASEVPAEKLTQCPDCGNKKIERLTAQGFGNYWVHCAGCGYLKNFPGRALISERDLIIHGFPVELLHHVNIFRGDIDKLMKISISEYLKRKYLSYNDFDIEQLKCLVGELATNHGVKIFFDYDVKKMAQTVRKAGIVEKLVASIVKDIPVDYQEKIKSAFSKIQGYDFPNYFVDNLLSKKLPLFPLLEEQEKERKRQEAELMEERKNRKAEFDIAELFK
ncbi:putative mediator of RNA polymerase II transcription subunit 26 isoform X2 [Macrosteles quadrilineatus]|nr:putative mediator of RNA polymerase II transcription subunit 26 isoform X2 [Macrosteles quadrilineatus]